MANTILLDYGWAISLIAAFLLDNLIGDPKCMPHVVRLMGSIINKLKKILLVKRYQKFNLITGFIFVLFNISIINIIIYIFEKFMGFAFLYFISSQAAFFYYLVIIILGAFYIVVLSQLIAVKSLKDESMKVYYSLINGDIDQARKNLSMIVGRDTENLTKEDIIKATVETISESTNDGIVAPLLYYGLGGISLIASYKIINTMDSMIGYKDEEHFYFGYAAAKIDDIANYIPAVVTAYISLLAAFILGMDYKNGYDIYKRDKNNHPSPNSGKPESVFAGILGIQLGGGSYYKGIYNSKPTIGNTIKTPHLSDIKKANKLMITISYLTLSIMLILKIFLIRSIN